MLLIVNCSANYACQLAIFAEKRTEFLSSSAWLDSMFHGSIIVQIRYSKLTDVVGTFATCRTEFKNRDQDREPGRNRRDVAGVSLILRVPRDSEWERNHEI